MGQAGAEHPEQGDPQPVHGLDLRQQRPAERREAEHYGQVLAERGLDRVQATHAGAVEQRQQGEQQAGKDG
ncbi:hypothetical protein D3C81_1923880 [compost metagenome]